MLFGVSRMEKVIHYGAVRATPMDSAVVASSGRFDTGGPANRYSTEMMRRLSIDRMQLIYSNRFTSFFYDYIQTYFSIRRKINLTLKWPAQKTPAAISLSLSLFKKRFCSPFLFSIAVPLLDWKLY